MKTVDLIPLILLELNEHDKYGFELIKSIETKSCGNIVIKQPTLYTILKKLEKSKFITSYWQDSEIGGKRHYYKLSEFGKIQVSTLPTMDELLSSIFEDEDSEAKEDEIIIDSTTSKEIEIKDSIIPSSAVFEDEIVSNPIDTSTTTEINTSNSDILKSEEINSEIAFAANENVSKFVENIQSTPIIQPIIESSEKTNLMPELDETPTNIENFNSVEYINYVNIKQDENYIISNKVAKHMMIKSIVTCLFVMAILITFNTIVEFVGSSFIFYTFCLITLVLALFQPIICAAKLEKIKDTVHTTDYNLNNSKKLLFNFGLILAAAIIVLVLNIATGINTINSMLSVSNFANFYAPILLSCCGLVDCLLYNILVRKLIK